MKIHKIYALLLCFFSLMRVSVGQSCYVELEDATGFHFTTDQLADLEAAACELRDAFPATFQNGFKVYDFGFYRHQAQYEGGLPQVFQDKIAEAAQLSPYFLLFGRELSGGGSVSEVWVEVRLPMSSSYSCATIERAENIQNLLKQYLNPGSDLLAANDIEAALVFIKPHLERIYSCCSGDGADPSGPACEVNEQYIADVLSADGYFSYEGLNITISDQTYQNIPTDKEVVVHLDDRCPMHLVSGTDFFNLTAELEAFVGELNTQSVNADIQIFYYDELSANDFLVDHFEENADAADYFNNEGYSERIYILDFEGSTPKVFFIFEFEGTGPPSFRSGAVGVPSWAKSAIKWLFKRAASSPQSALAGVVAEYAIEATIEYWFNNDAHENWFWALYEVADRRGWLVGIFVSFTENMVNSPIAYFIGELAKYLIETPYEEWSAADGLQRAGLGLVIGGLLSEDVKNLFPYAKIIAADCFVAPRLAVDFVGNPGLVKAWKVCFIDNVVRTNPEKLTKVSRYLDNNPSAEAAFKAEFNATTAARRGDFVDRASKIDDLNKLYNPGGGSPNFAPQGIDASSVPSNVYNDMVAEASAPQYLDEVIKSGSTVPNKVPVSGSYTLYKVVPKGSGPPSGVTPYWLKLDELNLHKNSPDFDQKLGLPLDSHSPKYDVYKIELNSGQQADVFESTIANTVEGGYFTTGGATQSLVLDRSKWSSPELLPDEIFPPAN